MNRIDILNALIVKNKFKSYCEIGVQGGHCFTAINCENKVGVDPDKSSAATLHITSDEFFENLDQNFDIFFIDGLHHADQVYLDITNALKHLNEGGIILCHDMLPTNKHMQEIPLTDQNEWTGDCWKAWVSLRTLRSNLTMHVVDTDWGCGIIKKGSQELLKIDGPVDYEGFVKNRNKWMKVISVAEFIKLYLV